MLRSFLAFTVALAIAAYLGAGASSVLAQVPPTPKADAPAANPADKYPGVQAALQLLNARDVNGCVAKLRDEARLHPELPSEYVMMYRILAQSNQPNAARFWLEKAVIETPSDPEPWVLLGNIALQDNRMAEAEIDFAKTKQLLASYTNKERKAVIDQLAMSGMAQVGERRERWAEAQARLQEYLKSNPKDVVALQRLARAMFWQQNVQEAYTTLKQAKEIDKENAATNKTREQLLPAEAILAQYYDAYEHANQKKWKESENAKTWFGHALKKAPNDLSLRAVVAVWALENGETALAKEQADEALRIEKENRAQFAGSIAGRMLSGYVALWDKRYEDAEKYFQEVILEAPNDFAAKNNIALALVEQKDPAKKKRALEYALANYQNNKENADALSTLSWVYFRTDNFDQAGLAMDQVLKATGGNVSNADTATYLAYVLDHNKRQFDAKQILSNIIENGRPFSMKQEAQKLYDSVKDAKKPEAK